MMRIPPYYQKAGWQRFLAGLIIGMIIGWFFFIYEFGTIQEKLVTQIKIQEATIKDQQENIEILRSDKDELNKQNQKKLTIEEIKVHFNNAKSLKLSELSTYELRSAIEKELTPIINKNIETVANTKELLFHTIENKIFMINEKKYRVIVKELYLFTSLELVVEIQLDN